MRIFTVILLTFIFFQSLKGEYHTSGSTELQQIASNYRQAMIDTKSDRDPINRILHALIPETEYSDQVVVELHQRYPFNRQLISSYIDSILSDGSWPDINYNDTKRSGWDAKKHADRILELTKFLLSYPPILSMQPSTQPSSRACATGSQPGLYVKTGGTTRSVFPRPSARHLSCCATS